LRSRSLARSELSWCESWSRRIRRIASSGLTVLCGECILGISNQGRCWASSLRFSESNQKRLFQIACCVWNFSDAEGRPGHRVRITRATRLLRGSRRGPYAGIAFRRGSFDSSPRYCVAPMGGARSSMIERIRSIADQSIVHAPESAIARAPINAIGQAPIKAIGRADQGDRPCRSRAFGCSPSARQLYSTLRTKDNTDDYH
jgi:hypothetical protein